MNITTITPFMNTTSSNEKEITDILMNPIFYGCIITFIIIMLCIITFIFNKESFNTIFITNFTIYIIFMVFLIIHFHFIY